MKRVVSASLSILCFILMTSAVNAARISLSVDPSFGFASNLVEATVAIRNNGDEEAHEVRVNAELDGRTVSSAPVDILSAGEEHVFCLALGSSPQEGSVIPVTISAEYLDQRGYPSTSVRAVPLSDPATTNISKALSVKIPRSTIRDITDINVVMSQRTNSSGIVTLELILPDEFASRKKALEVVITNGHKITETFSVTNQFALPGSSYRIFAVARWKEGNRDDCSIGRGRLTVPGYTNIIHRNEYFCLVASCLLIMGFIAVQFRSRNPDYQSRSISQRNPVAILVSAMCVIAVFWFILDHIPPTLLLKNTTTAGGDTVAHNYLASHLQSSLGTQGRVASWAQGWWCGFPMFQYYFPLPYLIMVVLRWIMPFNIAFKVVTVLGFFLLPLSTYSFARTLKLPHPGPAFMIIASIPMLFDQSNTMWGVNAYSTLAGMISNSISFPIMLFAIGSVFVDCNRGTFSFRSVILLVALLASHFFTSIMAALCMAIIPFMRTRSGFRRATRVLLQEGLLSLLLMSWWILPLMAKRGFAVDFGTNWDVSILSQLPTFLTWTFPLGIAGLLLSPWKGGGRFMLLTTWILLSAWLLFIVGYDRVSPVFVNVRLWPFIVFALAAISFGGAGIIASRRRGITLAAGGLFILSVIFGAERSGDIRSWAEWNYSGLEKKPGWEVFEDLVIPLDGSPGRLANDLHDYNNSLGSSRVFECVPHLIDKPILEGGIVNSAAGSLFSYYVQGETSRSCAGFPPIVTPTTFNMTNATDHLELFNVKHFIARWEKTKEALTASPRWARLGESRGWELHELTSHDGSYVVVSETEPVAVSTRNWKQAGLNWLYAREFIDQPFVFLGTTKGNSRFADTISEQTYRDLLESRPLTNVTQNAMSWRTNSAPIVSQEISDNRISFRTKAIGKPHIVKCTYYPNWRVKGAEKIYMVSPCFMLVYPTDNEVELYYGHTLSDYCGRILTVIGISCLLAGAWRKLFSARKPRRESWHVA